MPYSAIEDHDSSQLETELGKGKLTFKDLKKVVGS